MEVRIKQYKPLLMKRKYSSSIEEDIKKFLETLIFSKIFKETLRRNSKNILLEALYSGRVQYVDGEFKGSFNSKIIKEIERLGGRYNARTKGFTISRGQLPQEVQQAIGISNNMIKMLHTQLLQELASIDVAKAIQTFSIKTNYEQTLSEMDEQLKATLLKDITVVPEMTKGIKDKIATEYAHNMQLCVQNFAEEEIVRLRKLIEQNALEGANIGRLTKIIYERFQVTKRRAQFLARQESSLLLSKYREARYRELGLNEYKWSTSHDERVRKDHNQLDGLIFRWDNPPVINQRTGRRGHPGEDFGCRCIPIPVTRM